MYFKANWEFSSCINVLTWSHELPVTIMSSTYISAYVRWLEVWLTKRDVPDRHWTKPREIKTVDNFANHALGACFKSYNDFLRRHTWFRSVGSTKPEGWSMYIVSVSSPCKKALFTSTCLIVQPRENAIESTSRIVEGLMTGLKVSV